MKHYAVGLHGIAALCAASPAIALAAAPTAPAMPDTPDTPAVAADSAAAPIPVVVVSGSRTEHLSFDLPASVDVVDAARIDAAQPRVNASEALAAVPGVVVQNRQNYAQDLQISSRGFGARSAFGVRGVRLIADGVPATMPDGQGQAATFDLDMAERIEVLRGPMSALYGNHAGGVIQLFTRDPKGAPEIEVNESAGSYGQHKTDVNVSGKQGEFGFLLDGSRFRTDGYREHSAAQRDQAYAKLTFDFSNTSRLTIVAGGLRQNDTQDPLGVTWGTYQADPRAGEIDTTDTQNPKRTFADRYNTRKSIDHQQAGLTWDQRFGDDRLQLTVYGGNRRVIQYQSFSQAFQASTSSGGGVVDFDRDFQGFDAHYLMSRPLGDGTLRTTFGLETGKSNDTRQGYANYITPNVYGVEGALRRDEEDDVKNVDPYVQLEWERGRWVFTGGVRHSRVTFDVTDRFLSNGNDGGGVNYSHTTPMLGVLYKLTPELNVYASGARGFETPTLNELFYSGTGGGFNYHLAAATSTQYEVGAKAVVARDIRVNAALFQARTQNELAVDSSTGGRTSYRNAAGTLRQGLELSADADLRAGFSTKIAATLLRAIYDGAFTGVADGNRLPAVPKTSLFGELAWNDAGGRLGAALETNAAGKIYPDDANAAIPAPGYTIFNARVQSKQQLGSWRLREYARVNNLLDRTYIGSVIVGDTNKRYYEPAPGRNWIAGVSAQYQF